VACHGAGRPASGRADTRDRYPAKHEIYGLIDDLTGRAWAWLMASSEMPEILGVADRIMSCRRPEDGRILEERGTEEDILRAACREQTGERFSTVIGGEDVTDSMLSPVIRNLAMPL